MAHTFISLDFAIEHELNDASIANLVEVAHEALARTFLSEPGVRSALACDKPRYPVADAADDAA